MNDLQKIAQWILSDIHNNAPIYTDICKKVIPLYGSIRAHNISYRIDNSVLNIIADVPHDDSDYTSLIQIITSPDPINHGYYHMIPNPNHFNYKLIAPNRSPYLDTIFNYLYVMSHARNLKLNILLSSSSSNDDVKNDIKKNSPEYSDTSESLKEYLSHSDVSNHSINSNII